MTLQGKNRLAAAIVVLLVVASILLAATAEANDTPTASASGLSGSYSCDLTAIRGYRILGIDLQTSEIIASITATSSTSCAEGVVAAGISTSSYAAVRDSAGRTLSYASCPTARSCTTLPIIVHLSPGTILYAIGSAIWSAPPNTPGWTPASMYGCGVIGSGYSTVSCTGRVPIVA